MSIGKIRNLSGGGITPKKQYLYKGGTELVPWKIGETAGSGQSLSKQADKMILSTSFVGGSHFAYGAVTCAFDVTNMTRLVVDIGTFSPGSGIGCLLS